MIGQAQRFYAWAGGLLAVALLAGCGSEPTGTTIAAADLAGRISQGTAPVIFDVRTPEEYAGGHVPGAINIPHTEVAERAGEFSVYQDREVVVYCGSGKRAAIAEAALQQAGFSRIVDLEGHMQQWKADGYPLDRSVAEEPTNAVVVED